MIRVLFSFVLSVLLTAPAAAAATVDGADVYWSSTGSGDRVVILVHGWTCDLTAWSEQVPALARGHRVITLDLPGHGRSGTPQGGALSMDVFVRAIEAVRQEAGVERAVLVGHSMGATVIGRYAQLHPDRVRALALVDGYFVPAEGRRAFYEGLPSMRGPDGLKAREAFIQTMFVEGTHERVQKRILGMMLRTPETTAVAAMQAVAGPDAPGPEVIDLPAFGIYRRDAPPEMEAAAAYTRTLLPKLETQVMPDTGHFLMLEKPTDFNALLVSFVERSF